MSAGLSRETAQRALSLSAIAALCAATLVVKEARPAVAQVGGNDPPLAGLWRCTCFNIHWQLDIRISKKRSMGCQSHYVD